MRPFWAHVLGRRKWTVYAVGDSNGDCEVLDALLEGGKHGDALLAGLRELVPESGPGYNQDISKSLRDQIFEFRKPSGKGGTLRVLYFYDAGHVVICVSAFLKKSDQTPPEEIDRAVEVRKQYFTDKDRRALIVREIDDD